MDLFSVLLIFSKYVFGAPLHTSVPYSRESFRKALNIVCHIQDKVSEKH